MSSRLDELLGQLLELVQPDKAVEAAQVAGEVLRRESDMLLALDILKAQANTASLMGSRIDEERRREQERFATTIRMMGLPLIDVGDALLVPIIGALEDRRAEELTWALLQALQRHGTRLVIVDLSAIEHCDAATTERLLRAAKAIGLLGAKLVLSGIRPAVAATIVALEEGVKIQCYRSVPEALGRARAEGVARMRRSA